MSSKSNALIEFCRELFGTSNIIGTDIEDVSVENVEREFEQDRVGLRISFTVSGQFIGKTGKTAHNALEVLLPEKDD